VAAVLQRSRLPTKIFRDFGSFEGISATQFKARCTQFGSAWALAGARWPGTLKITKTARRPSLAP